MGHDSWRGYYVDENFRFGCSVVCWRFCSSDYNLVPWCMVHTIVNPLISRPNLFVLQNIYCLPIILTQSRPIHNHWPLPNSIYHTVKLKSFSWKRNCHLRFVNNGASVTNKNDFHIKNAQYLLVVSHLMPKIGQPKNREENIWGRGVQPKYPSPININWLLYNDDICIGQNNQERQVWPNVTNYKLVL